MPKEESKDAGESKDSGDDSEVPPLVAGFAQFWWVLWLAAAVCLSVARETT